MSPHVAVVAAVFATPGSGNESLVVVDVETDYAPRVDFARVRTELARAPFASTATSGTVVVDAVHDGASYLAGVRVADVAGLAPGELWVRVSLLSDAGVVVAQRTTQLAAPVRVAARSVS